MRRIAILFAIVFAAGAWTGPSVDHDDAKILRAAGIDDDGAKMVEYFHRRVVTDDDRAKIRTTIRALGHESFAERERASTELVRWGLAAVGPLRDALRDKDIEVVRRAEACLKQIERVPGAELSAAIARSIAKKKPDGATVALLTYLPTADDETVADEVRDALAALASAGGKGDPFLLKSLDDPVASRRAAAGEALIRANIPEARRLMSDADAEVRRAVCLAAVTRGRDKSAVAPLINLLVELPRDQAWRVEEVLVRLAGEQSPAVSLGKDDASRKHCRDAWNGWWSTAAAGIDLAKLDAVPRVLGYTLIVQGEQRTPAGQVYEINSSGNLIWKISSVQQPMDAVVIGKDRVLIAESGASQLSLRDFRGTVIWSKSLVMPNGIQPLPNGRYLIVSRGQVLEMNEKRDELFKFERERVMDICAACKDKNGDYWVLTHAGDCFRVDPQKKEHKPFKVNTRPIFGQMAGMDALANGKMLIAYANSVVEFDSNGNRGWAYNTTGQLSSVQRLANGNTLIASLPNRQIVELDRNKDVVWDYTPNDGSVPRKARRR